MHVQHEIVWLSQVHMAHVFESSIDNVSLHHWSIFAYKELRENPTTEDFSVVQDTSRISHQI